ncbi:FAD-binding domain-containing protein [Schizopora paradoxa]|uniref:FAD-binding domain-containing protein n=1 Tax=Schizopora paradoxa TaxID=27342 RepID=A0A0H2R7Y7_9AGAM|nr:FAD-binding domain-containing protein [Schizopora paradoxa]
MSSTFDAFKAAFQGDVVTPESPDYEASLKRWAANAERRAKVVAFVKSPQDVALAIKYAKDEGLDLSIRGGGHNPGGSSSSEGGLVIDLSRHLNGCRIDADNKRAYVAGGAIWETVDKEAIKHGLASVGGTVNHVHRLTLGGGYGWLSSEHGLVIDNLLQATMVVADGSILTASATENTDLFWAIRGGGCNFGVCTEFVYQLHEQRPTVYSGILIFPPPLLDAVLDVTEKWYKGKPSAKESLMQIISRGPPPECAPGVIVVPFFNGTESEGREKFKAFLDLNPIDLTKELPYEAMNSLQNPNVQHGQCIYMRGVTQLEYSPATVKEVFAAVVDKSTKDMRVSTIFELFPLEKINSVRNDECAFNIRCEASNILSIVAWDQNTPENQKKGQELSRAMTSIISSKEAKPEDSKDRAYGNYVGDETLTTDKARRVFGDNYPRLQTIKKKYDPEVIFSKWFAITPA